MRWITLITSVIFTFSSLGAQEYSISPTSPFFNKIVESPNYNSSNPSNPIRVSALTFNKVFVCAPKNVYLWIVIDRNDVVSDIDGNGLNDIPFTAADYVDSWGGSWPGYAYVAFQTSLGNFECVAVSNEYNTPYGISVGDFNGDGKKDLFFTAARSGAAFTLINNGGWSFTEQMISGVGFVNHIAVRNVNAGPGAEILFTDEYRKLYKYNFLSNSLTTLNTECKEGLSVADINNDGNQDIVCGTTASNDTGYIKFQLNLGGSSWSSLYLLNNQSRRWHGIKTGDFNKDGKIDVAACSADDRSVHIFYNNGGNPPTFTEAAVVYTGSPFDNCELAVADLDCDGDYDIVWSSSNPYNSGPKLGYLENGYPNNTWTNYIIENVNTYSIYGVAVSDINNDKKPDIVAGVNNGLYIYYNISNIDTTKCAPITPVNVSEIRPKTNIFINKNEVSISFEQPVNGIVSLYEISGRKVLNKKLDNQKVSFRVDKQGIYIIEINTDKLKQKQTILIK